MTGFTQSRWAKPDFSQGYRDNADLFIVERQRMLSILQSFYVNFVRDGTPKRMLDLGCGDGIVTAAIAEVDPALAATLVDGSPEMLTKAEDRLRGLAGLRIIQASFEGLTTANLSNAGYDFIASSLAIHHLAMAGKSALFELIHSQLKPGAWFVNIDVILAPSDRLEQWYMHLWSDWIVDRKRGLNIPGDQFNDIPRQYKDNQDNKPDTLPDQLEAMAKIGFLEVDCFYKYGIFAIFGGRRAT